MMRWGQYSMGEVVSFKNEIDELQVQYDILSPFDYIGKDERKKDINERIDELDIFLEKNRSLVNDVNSEIDRLTNHADGVDYTVAVACGVVAGLVDVFFVGEFDFEGSYEQINKKFDDIVEKKAKQVEEKEKEQRIAKAINDAKEKAAKKGETISVPMSEIDRAEINLAEHGIFDFSELNSEIE